MTTPEPSASRAGPRLAATTFRGQVLIALVVAGAALIADSLPRHTAGQIWLKVAVSVGTVAAAVYLWLNWRSFAATDRRYWAKYAGLPAQTTVARGRRFSRAVISRETAARYGGSASEMALLVTSRLRHFRLVALIWLTGTLAYLNVYGNIYEPVWLWSWLAFSAVLGGLVLASWQSFARANAGLHKSVESELDRPISELLPLPRTPDEYASWCVAHSLQPYPAGRPDWTDLTSASPSDA